MASQSTFLSLSAQPIMESRVLSRATAFAAIPQPRKLPRESACCSCSVPARRAVGTVAGGGNLIWGRQLRPALLLEGSPLSKADALRPCRAAASSPSEGNDSAG